MKTSWKENYSADMSSTQGEKPSITFKSGLAPIPCEIIMCERHNSYSCGCRTWLPTPPKKRAAPDSNPENMPACPRKWRVVGENHDSSTQPLEKSISNTMDSSNTQEYTSTAKKLKLDSTQDPFVKASDPTNGVRMQSPKPATNSATSSTVAPTTSQVAGQSSFVSSTTASSVPAPVPQQSVSVSTKENAPITWGEDEPLPTPAVQDILKKFRTVEVAFRIGHQNILQATTELDQATADLQKAKTAASTSLRFAKAAIEAAERADVSTNSATERQELMRRNLAAAMRAQDTLSSGMSMIMREVKRYGIQVASEQQAKEALGTFKMPIDC